MIAPVLLCCLGLLPPPQEPEPPPEPLNVVLVVLDDVGLEFLELYDDENELPADIEQRVPHFYPQMPALARLAGDGVRFTQARVNPACSTTRATLLSGRYAFRHGVGGLVRPLDGSPFNARAETIEFGVGPGNQEWTLAHVARAAGLTSFLCGKYHLALQPDQPALGGAPGYGWEHIRKVAGFDGYWSTWENLVGTQSAEVWVDKAGQPVPAGYYNFVACANGALERHRGEYATSVQIDKAIDFVDAHPEDPFLLVLPFNAAHDPWQLPPPGLVATDWYVEQARREPAEADSSWVVYCAMLEALDRKLGRLVATLEQRGRYGRTVFFVVGDNGTPTKILRRAVERDGLDLGPVVPALLRPGQERFKHTVWEPGVRVPLIVSGPVVVDPGRSSDALVDAPDLFETIRDLLGVPLEAFVSDQRVFDGVSLLPLLRDPAARSARRFSLVERFEPGGNPETIVHREGEMSQKHERRMGFVLETEEGRLKLVRNLDETGQGGDLLFRLTDAQGSPVDPWELDPIPDRGKANHRRHETVRAALDALLRSEARNWPPADPAPLAAPPQDGD